MSCFEYIFFDLDGTIINSAGGVLASVRYSLEKMKLPVPERETLLKFIGPPLTDSYHDFCGLNREDTDRAVTFYREHYREHGMLDYTLYDGIPSLIKKLHQCGKKPVLATSKPGIFSKKIIEHAALANCFALLSCASADERGGDKGDIILSAIDKLKITDKSHAIMIGDRLSDINGAKKAGLKSIGVLYGFGSREELENAGADFIASNAAELEKILLE